MPLAPAHALAASPPALPLPTSSAPAPPPSALVLFRVIANIALTVLEAITLRIHRMPITQSFNYLRKASVCIYRMTAIEVTLIRTPERITPAQLVRLAKAQRTIERLTGRPIDFSAFQIHAQQTTNDNPAAKPQPNNPQSALHNPQPTLRRLQGPRVIGPLSAPGAVLANLFQELAKLQASLPEDPSPAPAPEPYPPAPTIPSQPAQPAAPSASPSLAPLRAAQPAARHAPHPLLAQFGSPLSAALLKQFVPAPSPHPATHGQRRPPP